MLKGKEKGHIIRAVHQGSAAEELGIEPNDALLEINGREIEDIFDYRYLIKNEYVEVLIRKPNAEEWLLEIEKEYEEDLGLDFGEGLMSEYRSCSNKCIFCFIDQMPRGMRDTLYFKDDDSRLSFLQGNYITLTNMKERDIKRIIKMKLAPINISVHTTNPKLRCEMLKNRFAGEKLKFLDMLYEGRVEMNGQIVLCKNINDKKELERTMKDLSRYIPFMKSVSVVPAGITKHREGLFPLELCQREEAREVIGQIEAFQERCLREHGIRFVHASDEWYIMAEREFPQEESYDGYIQLENGVGMMRKFINEFEEAQKELLQGGEYERLKRSLQRTVTFATGKLAFPTILSFAKRLMEAFPLINIEVYPIRNDFFGETITASGLITGKDLTGQLKGRRLGERLYIPANMLRRGEQVFLDDMTLTKAQEILGVGITPVEADGKDIIEAVLNEAYTAGGRSEGFVYGRTYK